MGFRSSILAGVNLVRQAIQSPNYVAGTSGWSIKRDGSAEFSEMVIRSSDGISQDVVIDNGQIDFGATGSTATITGSYIEFRDRETGVPKTRADKNGYVATDNLSPYQLRNTFSAEGMAIETPGNELLSGPSLTASIAAGTFTGWEMSTGQIGASDDAGILSFTADASSAVLSVESNEGMAAIAVNGTDIGAGITGYANITASTATTTSTTDTIAVTLASRTYSANRAYEIKLKAFVSSTVAADEVGLRVRKTDAAGAVLLDVEATGTVHRASQNYMVEVSNIVKVGASAVTAAMVLTYFRRSGTGNARIVASAVNPAFIEIKDVGAAADYPNATTLS